MSVIGALIDKFRQRVPCQLCPIKNSITEIALDQPRILESLVEISQWNPYYSKTILKCIITALESSSSEIEIDEEYYERLMEWLPAKEPLPTDTDVISYPLGRNRFTNIKESRNLISGLGTTGLRTWEASLFVTDYLLNQISNEMFDRLFNGKDVLELGCGTGFIGISLFKYRSETTPRIYMTDGDSQLIDNIDANLHLNSIDKDDNKFDVRKLWWGEDPIPDGVSTLIAADVTYDSSIIPSLIKTLKDSMTTGDVKDLILGATVRNVETLQTWENFLVANEYIWDWAVITEKPLVASPVEDGLWFREGTAPIKIYHVTRK